MMMRCCGVGQQDVDGAQSHGLSAPQPIASCLVICIASNRTRLGRWLEYISLAWAHPVATSCRGLTVLQAGLKVPTGSMRMFRAARVTAIPSSLTLQPAVTFYDCTRITTSTLGSLTWTVCPYRSTLKIPISQVVDRSFPVFISLLATQCCSFGLFNVSSLPCTISILLNCTHGTVNLSSTEMTSRRRTHIDNALRLSANI